MSTELWSARLNPSSPRYLRWRRIFDTDEIPLASPFPLKAKLGDNPDIEMIYMLDWNNMDYESAERLIEFVVDTFKVDTITASRQLDKDGVFPIRQSDVIVSFSLRAFL